MSSNKSTARTFRVTNMANYTDNLKKLASLNPDWKLSPEEIVESGKTDQKIYKLRFTNRPVKLQPDEIDPNAIAVIIAGYQIGNINKEESAQVKSILDTCDIRNIACGIWGGQSKIVDESYNVETQNQGISVTVRITYHDLSVVADDDLDFRIEESVPRKQSAQNKKSKKKKPIFKRWWFWVIVAVLALALFGGGSDEQTGESTTRNDPIPQATDPAPSPLKDSGTLGDFEIQIHDYTLADDYWGDPAILIDFTFTNNSEENASAYIDLIYMAYQNGVQLDHATFIDDSRYDANNLTKEIQPGVSIELTAAYSLTSDTAPVEFEVSESFAFTDDTLGKTYEISEGGKTVLSTAPTGSFTDEIFDCTVSIVSYKITEDYEHKNAILFELGFTNNTDDSTNFYSAFSFTPFQNGVELETAILSDDLDHIGNTIVSVKPGAGIPVSVAYILSSETAPVEIEITDSWGFSDKVIKTQIDLS